MRYKSSADDKAEGEVIEWNMVGEAGSNGGRSASGCTFSEEPRSE